MATDKTLDHLRTKIDAADDKLLEALAERMAVVKKVGIYKKERAIPPLDPKRWQEVLTTKRQKAKALKLSEELVEDIYERIHKEALLIER